MKPHSDTPRIFLLARRGFYIKHTPSRVEICGWPDKTLHELIRAPILRRIAFYRSRSRPGTLNLKQKRDAMERILDGQLSLSMRNTAVVSPAKRLDAVSVRIRKGQVLDQLLPLHFPSDHLNETPWPLPTKKQEAFKKCTDFNVFAWDVESDGQNHEPFMLACVRYDPAAASPDSTLRDEACFYEDTPHESICTLFLLHVFDRLVSHFNRVDIYFSYNGSGYDHFPLSKAWYAMQDWAPYKNITCAFGMGGGGSRITLLEFTHKLTKSKAIFRDAAQLLPAGSRGKLSKVAKACKSPWHKDESISVADIFAACALPPQRRLTDENYQKIRQYCIRDCWAVFGVAMFYCKLFASSPRIFRDFLQVPQLDAELCRSFGIAYYGFTLANLVFQVAPYALDPDEEGPAKGFDFVELFPVDFWALTQPGPVAILRRSIYGGRCLAPSIGLIFSERFLRENKLRLSAWDVSSMYPQAARAPLPAGHAYYMSREDIVKINAALADGTFNPYNFPAFIGVARFVKEKTVFHTRIECMPDWWPAHHPLDLLPIVPWRSGGVDNFTADSLLHKKCGPLEWVNDTPTNDGLVGFYNSVHLFTLMEAGFHVELLADRPEIIRGLSKPELVDGVPVIAWPRWTDAMKLLMDALYHKKFEAKKRWSTRLKAMMAGGAGADETNHDFEINLAKGEELFQKIMLNSLIGKFAQRPAAKLEKNSPVKNDQRVGNLRSLFQLNSYIMAAKDRIGHHLVCWASTDQHDIAAFCHPYLKAPGTPGLTIQRQVCYTDTDCIQVLHSEAENPEEALVKAKLLANGLLGNYNQATCLFDYKLEVEGHDNCDVSKMPSALCDYFTSTYGSTKLCRFLSNFYFCAARKFYVWECPCGNGRYKNKGHRSYDAESGAGIKPQEIVAALAGQPNVYALYEKAACYCGDCLLLAFNDMVYPTLPPHVNANSGTFFSIRSHIPKSHDDSFRLFNNHLTRTISVVRPPFQQACPICKFSIHK